jgi:TIR domain
MGRIEKTVFISYRRHDAGWANAVFMDLTQHGYDVFIDYEGIGSGNFETAILENIRARAHFLVLLTRTALERSGDPRDWMRREIEAALDSQRNIVPVLLEGFKFGTGDQLTGRLAALQQYNGLTVPEGYLRQAMEKLRNQFLSVPVDAVLHPASASAQRIAKEQKDKAAAVLEDEQSKLASPENYEEPPRASTMPLKSPRILWFAGVSAVAAILVILAVLPSTVENQAAPFIDEVVKIIALIWIDHSRWPLQTPPNSGVAPPASAKPGEVTEGNPAHDSTVQPWPQATPTDISPQDAATQLGAWDSVLPRVNELVNAYNSLDLALVSWESKAKLVGERDALAKGVRAAAANLLSAGEALDKIREQYPDLRDLIAALSNSPAEQLNKAGSVFADAVTQNGSEADDARIVRLRRLEGALKLQMAAMDNWMTDLGRKANLRVRDLSGIK